MYIKMLTINVKMCIIYKKTNMIAGEYYGFDGKIK